MVCCEGGVAGYLELEEMEGGAISFRPQGEDIWATESARNFNE